jgi:hypothetical protein
MLREYAAQRCGRYGVFTPTDDFPGPSRRSLSPKVVLISNYFELVGPQTVQLACSSGQFVE